MIGHVLNEMFGAGAWGVAGNLVASAILTVPAVVITHVRAHRQRERHYQDMKKHVTQATGGSVGNDNGQA